jgi:hypothetical protein
VVSGLVAENFVLRIQLIACLRTGRLDNPAFYGVNFGVRSLKAERFLLGPLRT